MFIQIIIFQILTFLGIILVLRGVLYRHARQAVNRLQSLHEATLEKETVLKEEIEAAKQMREEEIKRAQIEGQQLTGEMTKEAQDKAKEILASAEAEAEKILEKAKVQLEKFKSEATASLERKAAGWIEKAIDTALSPRSKTSFHQELVDELLEELEGQGKINGLASESVDSIEVVTAGLLTDAQTKRINRLLEGCFKNKPAVHYRVEADLLGGLILDLRKKTIDGSLRNRIRQALRLARES